MAKLDFTFLWGKRDFITRTELWQILEYYVQHKQLQDVLNDYVTKQELSTTLENYALKSEIPVVENLVTKEEFNEEITTLQENIDSNTTLIEEVDNELKQSLAQTNEQVRTNATNIQTNQNNIGSLRLIQDELVEKLKQARLWNIKGVWDSTTNYVIGDVVGLEESKILYVALKDNTNKNPSDNPDIWFPVSGVQSIDLTDYYNKTQIDALLEDIRNLIKALDTRIKTLETNYEALDAKVNTKADASDLNGIRDELSKKANTNDLTNYAKLNESNNFTQANNFSGDVGFLGNTIFSEGKGFNCFGTALYQGHSIHITNIDGAANSDESSWAGFIWGEGANQPMTLQGYNGLNIVTPNGVTLNSGTKLRHDTEHSLEIGFANGKKIYLVDQDNINNGWDVATKSYVDSKIGGEKDYEILTASVSVSGPSNGTKIVSVPWKTICDAFSLFSGSEWGAGQYQMLGGSGISQQGNSIFSAQLILAPITGYTGSESQGIQSIYPAGNVYFWTSGRGLSSTTVELKAIRWKR